MPRNLPEGRPHGRAPESNSRSSKSESSESRMIRNSGSATVDAMLNILNNSNPSIIATERTLRHKDRIPIQGRAVCLNERLRKGADHPVAPDGTPRLRNSVQNGKIHLKLVEQRFGTMGSRLCSSSISSEPRNQRSDRKSCPSTIETVTQTSDGLKQKLLAPALRGCEFAPIELGVVLLEEKSSVLNNPKHHPDLPKSLSELEQRSKDPFSFHRSQCKEGGWRVGAECPPRAHGAGKNAVAKGTGESEDTLPSEFPTMIVKSIPEKITLPGPSSQSHSLVSVGGMTTEEHGFATQTRCRVCAAIESRVSPSAAKDSVPAGRMETEQIKPGHANVAETE